jgi:hypothetical protein
MRLIDQRTLSAACDQPQPDRQNSGVARLVDEIEGAAFERETLVNRRTATSEKRYRHAPSSSQGMTSR